VKNDNIEGALRRIPHVVQVTEEGGMVVISCSQPFDTTKDELLRIDQKIRDRTAEMWAHKRALNECRSTGFETKSEENETYEIKLEPKYKKFAKDDTVVLHAILRLLEQRGPVSLDSLHESFQEKWKCPFRPAALGIHGNDLEVYFRESEHFRLFPGPECSILCLKTPAVREMPIILDQINDVRQQVSILGAKLEELQATLERERIRFCNGNLHNYTLLDQFATKVHRLDEMVEAMKDETEVKDEESQQLSVLSSKRCRVPDEDLLDRPTKIVVKRELTKSAVKEEEDKGANSQALVVANTTVVVACSDLALVEKDMNSHRAICDVTDCSSYAVGKVDHARRCKRHGGGPRCSLIGCASAAIGRVSNNDEYGPAGDRCRKHNGGAKCSVLDCPTAAFSTVRADDRFGPPGPRCKRHGGGGRCNVDGCGNCAAGKVMSADFFGPPGHRCKGHGAGVLCQFPPGCSRLASGGKIVDELTGNLEYRCSSHGGGARCDIEGCLNLCTGRTLEEDHLGPIGQRRCRRHGGIIRCEVNNCGSSAVHMLSISDQWGPPGKRCRKHHRDLSHSVC